MAVQPKKFTAWSYSRWYDYRQCPLKAKLKYLDKQAEPENPAMARGSAIHKLAEDFLKGLKRTVPKELKTFADLLKRLKKQVTLKVEEQWAFTSKWDPTGWFGAATWCRVKMDVAVPGKILQVVDWKTGKLNPDHQEQLGLYALAGLRQFPDAEQVETVLAYVDQPLAEGVNPFTRLYDRAELPGLQKEWEKRTRPMMNDTKFAPRPNDRCRWCHYRASNGGPCKY